MTTIRVNNTRTTIEGAHPLTLDLLDDATSYLKDPNLTQGKDVKRWNIDDQDYAWDGYHRFLTRPPGMHPYVPTGLRHLVCNVLTHAQVPHEIVDERVPPQTAPFEGMKPIPVWDHQEAAIQQLMAHPDGVARMPPRAGKTRTLLETVRRLGLNTIWVAPTSAIVKQTVRAAREFFPKEAVQLLQGKKWQEHKDALITVCTAGTMLKLPAEFWQTRHMIVADEVHHYLANKSWGRTMLENTRHIYHRKGMTGTFFRSSGDDLALLAFISDVVYEISSAELKAKGHLVPTYCAWIPVKGPRVYKTSGEWNGPRGHGTLGIHKHEFRNDIAASVAKHLQNKNRTVLVLVSTKAQGYAIAKRLEQMYPPTPSMCEFKHVEFVSTDRKKPVIERILESFRSRQEVKILIGTSMVGEGVDLPSADALVYAAGMKAAVAYVQSLYRVCTSTPGKEYAVVVDFADHHHKKLLAHSRHRNIVMQSDPVFQSQVLGSLEEFVQWSEHVWVPNHTTGA